MITTPFSSVGLADTTPSTSEVKVELDRLLHRGSEYDFLTRRGMRDWVTGSGMRTQWSLKWTWTRLLLAAGGGVVIVHDIAGEMVAVDERVVEDEAGTQLGLACFKVTSARVAPGLLCYGLTKTSSDHERPEVCPYMVADRRSNSPCRRHSTPQS